jgi:hypothetical protein
VCLAHQAGSSCAVPAAVLDLTGARPEQVLQVGGAMADMFLREETCSLRLAVACAKFAGVAVNG